MWRSSPRQAIAAIIASVLATAILATGPVAAERRLALVVGNSGYAFGKLPNPVRDAQLLTSTLQRVGFEVTTVLDADQRTFKKAMVDFGRRLQEEDTVGLFYYAGHGVQVDGENYLIPIGAEIADEREVAVEALAMTELMKTMTRSAARINIVILDACRNNPFASASRSLSGGLARVDAPAGTIIAYATSPGEVALDGTGSNSPFSRALATAIEIQGITIEDAFKRTRREVLATTGEKQRPWESTSLTGDFMFKPGPPATASNETGQAPPEDERLVELRAYEAIKTSGSAAGLEAYLARFPDGSFSELVRLRLAKLTSGGAEPGAAITAEVNENDTSPAGLFARGQAAEATDPAKASGLYELAAQAGHAGAMTALGELFDRGSGVPENPSTAANWYRAAADKGDAGGLARLAELTEKGRGVGADPTEAARLYRRAAAAGSARALNGLGEMLRDGRGMPQDENEAFAAFEKAANLNYPQAMFNLARQYETGRGAERNLAEAVRWYQRAAGKSYAPAMTALAVLLELGTGGVPKDLEQAVKLLETAAATGDPQGMTSLAYLYEQGKGVTQDLAKAAELYRSAAGQGEPRAMHNLAVMLEEGRGVDQRFSEAAELYRAAADKNYVAAMLRLAVLLDEGRGVERDPDAAAALILDALKRGHKAARDQLFGAKEPFSAETRQRIEERLKAAGVFKGKIDGRFDDVTRTALRSFAKAAAE